MRLHLKLMTLLAAFGLLPTLLVGLYGRAALHDLGSDLAERGRIVITGRLTAGMADTIAQAAAILDSRRVALEMALRAQASEVERRLADDEPGPTGTLPASVIRQGAPLPGAQPSPVHGPAIDPAAVSLTLAKDARTQAALAQARALADLPAEFGALRDALDGGLLWQFVITAEGLHLTWPAHAGEVQPLGEWQDPRLLPWFSHALETGAPVWTAPHRDPVSGQLVLTAGMPIFDDGGMVTGVTGMHVSVMAGAQVLQDQAELPRGTTGMLVMPQPGTAGQAGADLRLLAVTGFPAEPGTGWAPPADDGETSLRLIGGQQADHPAFRQMIRTLAEGGSGTARLPYRGEPALWAYGALPGSGVAVIYVVPFERLNAMAESVALMVEDATSGQLAATGAAMLAILGLAVAGAWVGARQVIEPLHALSHAMERVAAGDLAARAPVTSRDEVGGAARRFNAMVPLLEDRLSLRQGLDLAQDVQQALLPAAAPSIAGFDLSGVSLYSDETGGDYFDFVPVAAPNRWAVMVGDVSGHGISAALLMTTIRAMLRARVRGSTDPAALLQSVNPLLAEDVSAGRFMTLFCLFIEAGKSDVLWSSAGHGDCLLFDPAAGTLETLEGDDIPLGVDGTWTFSPSHRRVLQPGQILLLGTDGLLEARDADGREFGVQGLRAAMTVYLGQARHVTADGICGAILEGCAAHRGDKPPRDDTTLVVVRAVAAPQ